MREIASSMGISNPGFVPAHLDEGLYQHREVRCRMSSVAYGAGVKCVSSGIAQLVIARKGIPSQIRCHTSGDVMRRPSGPMLHVREEREACGRLQ